MNNKDIIRSTVAAALMALALTVQATEYRLQKSRDFQPEYPRAALNNGLEGWVDLRVTVNPDGAVSQLEVVDAEPRRVFERSALRAANQWQFVPPAEAGIAEPQQAVFRVTFRLQ